jgi:hypothetical protein
LSWRSASLLCAPATRIAANVPIRIDFIESPPASRLNAGFQKRSTKLS